QPAFQRALGEYEAELALHADRASHLGQLGLLRLRQGRVGEAEQAWDRAIRAEPRASGDYVNLAALDPLPGREKAAERLRRDALELTPGDGLLAHALRLALMGQQERAPALGHLRRAWEVQPENRRTGYVLA